MGLFVEQGAGWDVERLGQVSEVEDGEVADSALDPGQVDPIYATSLRQGFLGHTALMPHVADAHPHSSQERRDRVLRHGGMVARRLVAYGLHAKIASASTVGEGRRNPA